MYRFFVYNKFADVIQSTETQNWKDIHHILTQPAPDGATYSRLEVWNPITEHWDFLDSYTSVSMKMWS